MSEKNTGGPAFKHETRDILVPDPDGGNVFGSAGRYETGLTIRDYFAAKAMQALFSSEVFVRGADKAAHKAGVTLKEMMAEQAYQMADNMLEARDK
jgi:hypothetical protein